MAKATPETWLILSDLHCGSTVALHPPDFETDEGYKVRHNRVTGWIWECWQDTIKRAKEAAKGGTLNVLINGDLIEGVHHKTTEVWSPDPADHARAALECLHPLAEAAGRVVVVLGTECHTGNSERRIAASLGAVACNVYHANIGGVQVKAIHHMPATSREWLKSNGLGMELANHQLGALRSGRIPPRLVIMSHRHVYGCYSDGDSMAIATHAWQGLTRYGHKVVRTDNVHVGATLLSFEGGGALPVVTPFRYRMPEGEGCQQTRTSARIGSLTPKS